MNKWEHLGERFIFFLDREVKFKYDLILFLPQICSLNKTAKSITGSPYDSTLTFISITRVNIHANAIFNDLNSGETVIGHILQYFVKQLFTLNWLEPRSESEKASN